MAIYTGFDTGIQAVLTQSYPGDWVWMVREDVYRFGLEIILTNKIKTRYVRKRIPHLQFITRREDQYIEQIRIIAEEMMQIMQRKPSRSEEVMEKLLQ